MPTFHLAQPVRATRSVVWQAVASARGLAGWQADEVEGSVTAGSQLVLRYPALGAEIDVMVADVVRDERVVFTMGPTRIVLSLQDGGVSLSHSDLPAGDEYAGTGSAWALSLATLAHACERHPGRTRQVRWFVGPVTTEASTAHAFFTHGAALDGWLGRGDGLGPPGSAFSRRLGEAFPLSGRVLTNVPGRDVLLSWQEDDDALLCLRTLPSPLSRDERLVAMVWSRWAEASPDAELAARLEGCHRRLLSLLGTGARA